MPSGQKAMPSKPQRPRNLGIRALCACVISLLISPVVASAQEASADPQLSLEQQSIVAISAHTARGDTAALQSALNNGLDAGLSINEIKEVMVHLYAYCGFPRSLGGLTTFIGVLEEREARGIEDEVGETASPQLDDGSAYARGEKVLASVAAGWSPTAPQSGYVAFAPVIEQFLREHLFGDIFGRDVLSYSEREIVTISALASMDGVEPYLKSHMGVGMNVGLTEAQIEGILSVVGTNVGEARAEVGRDILSRVVALQPEPQGGAPSGAQDDRNGAEANRSLASTGATIFPRGARLAASDNFTGAVWVDMVVTEAETYDTRIGNVTFEPGSRTDWHLHPGGQILLVTGGSGYHQVQGEPVHLIRKGDVVKVAPGVAHWHGALPDSELTHAAVATKDSAGETVWLEPVTDDEYYRTW
ncbi:MAG: carboxymuconolactone decarboxylase family protein [Steroidobacteraceae bacterium]